MWRHPVQPVRVPLASTDRGDAPVVLEPVPADIELTRPGNFTVHVLDHNGRKTGRTLPVDGGRFHIDGARDRTPYYLISF